MPSASPAEQPQRQKQASNQALLFCHLYVCAAQSMPGCCSHFAALVMWSCLSEQDGMTFLLSLNTTENVSVGLCHCRSHTDSCHALSEAETILFIGSWPWCFFVTTCESCSQPNCRALLYIANGCGCFSFHVFLQHCAVCLCLGRRRPVVMCRARGPAATGQAARGLCDVMVVNHGRWTRSLLSGIYSGNRTCAS